MCYSRKCIYEDVSGHCTKAPYEPCPWEVEEEDLEVYMDSFFSFFKKEGIHVKEDFLKGLVEDYVDEGLLKEFFAEEIALRLLLDWAKAVKSYSKDLDPNLALEIRKNWKDLVNRVLERDPRDQEDVEEKIGEEIRNMIQEGR